MSPRRAPAVLLVLGGLGALLFVLPLVGLLAEVPWADLPELVTSDVVTTAVQSLGLSDVAEFDIEKKVVGMPSQDGPLVNLKVADFVDEVSRDTPAPGGGSIAALAGAIGSALASMVVNLSVGKGEYDHRYGELCELAERAQAIKDRLLQAIDADTEAFNEVIAGIRMPKDTEEQLATRSAAIRAGYKTAAEVPLETAKLCRQVLDLCQQAADIVLPF